MVETFTLADFEAALPRNKATGAALCRSLGVVQGEYAFLLPVSDKVGVIIRSSVRADGMSAGRGEDSIRLWLVDSNNAPLGSKLSRWIARTGGWRDRLTEQARTLYGLAKRLGACPKCGNQLRMFKVRKEGPNKGRIFVKCVSVNACDHFEWVD